MGTIIWGWNAGKDTVQYLCICRVDILLLNLALDLVGHYLLDYVPDTRYNQFIPCSYQQVWFPESSESLSCCEAISIHGVF